MFIFCQMEIFVSEGTKLSFYFFFSHKLIFKTAAHVSVFQIFLQFFIEAKFKYIF